MHPSTAKQISDLMIEVGTRLSESVALVSSTESDPALLRYRDSVSKLLSTMLIEVMNPLLSSEAPV